MIIHSQFTAPAGNEHFFSGVAPLGKSFREDAIALLNDYESAKRSFGVTSKPFLLRFHLSDITNQAFILRQLLGNYSYTVSLIGQSPADSRLALEAWHCPEMVQRYPLKWTQLADNGLSGSYAQTQEEFAELKRQLHPVPVAFNVLRTWLYCRDVDNNYQGLVNARNDFFAANGINTSTGFIASTGIEGQHENPKRLVKMDTLSMPGIKREQIQHLSAPQWLSDTIVYGVSFERGSKIIFDDRNWLFISGTASIDYRGEVVHTGDVQLQTSRMIDNIQALLQNGNAQLEDLRQATLYLRDLNDAPVVRKVLSERLPVELPFVILHAPVCRPAWLVEMEAIAVTG